MKKELRAKIKAMKAKWQAYQGEDSLHEMAFGEPW